MGLYLHIIELVANNELLDVRMSNPNVMFYFDHGIWTWLEPFDFLVKPLSFEMIQPN